MSQPIAYHTATGDNTLVEVTPTEPLPVTGGTAIGAVDDAAETDPGEEATVIALLKGILTELQAQTVLLTAIETNTGT